MNVVLSTLLVLAALPGVDGECPPGTKEVCSVVDGVNCTKAQEVCLQRDKLCLAWMGSKCVRRIQGVCSKAAKACAELQDTQNCQTICVPDEPTNQVNIQQWWKDVQKIAADNNVPLCDAVWQAFEQLYLSKTVNGSTAGQDDSQSRGRTYKDLLEFLQENRDKLPNAQAAFSAAVDRMQAVVARTRDHLLETCMPQTMKFVQDNLYGEEISPAVDTTHISEAADKLKGVDTGADVSEDVMNAIEEYLNLLVDLRAGIALQVNLNWTFSLPVIGVIVDSNVNCHNVSAIITISSPSPVLNGSLMFVAKNGPTTGEIPPVLNITLNKCSNQTSQNGAMMWFCRNLDLIPGFDVPLAGTKYTLAEVNLGLQNGDVVPMKPSFLGPSDFTVVGGVQKPCKVSDWTSSPCSFPCGDGCCVAQTRQINSEGTDCPELSRLIPCSSSSCAETTQEATPVIVGITMFVIGTLALVSVVAIAFLVVRRRMNKVRAQKMFDEPIKSPSGHKFVDISAV